MTDPVYRGRYRGKKYKRKTKPLELPDTFGRLKMKQTRPESKVGNLLSEKAMGDLDLSKSGLGRTSVGSQYTMAVQRAKKRKKSSNPLVIDFDVQDAQDGLMDEHELNDIVKVISARRGGALIAGAMTPDERSARSKKGWLKRQRARQQMTSPQMQRLKSRQSSLAGNRDKGKKEIPAAKDVKSIGGVNSLLGILAQMSKDAESKGKDAPNYDLCKVSIPGTNLFCGSNRGIPRKNMPQLSGKPVAGSRAAALTPDDKGEVNADDAFKEHLKAKGVKLTRTRVKAASLKASQSELVGAKVAGMRQAHAEGKYDPGKKPIYVSRDGYVIDGHHRWAAVVGIDSQDGKLGDTDMNVEILDMDIDEALKFVNEFTDEFGIAQKAAQTGDATVKKYDDFGYPIGLSEIDDALLKSKGCGCGCS